ncbi:hypothetical protein [Paludisphaera soli]|uniref:hypothetical protein n=1 Tax=Paludisphaera soli TaxID=2712865 RepID=UPI0013ED85AE|nr:hypothetical protein [Paludisphaera soli]
MSQARRNRRVLAVMSACAVMLAAGAGCRHSPFHRVADSPRPDSVAAVERAAIPELAPVVATKAAPAEAAAAAAAQTSAGAEADPVAAPEAVAALTPAPTPMLDAALRRAEADEEAERRSLLEALAPRRAPDPEPEAAPTAPPPSRPEPLEPEVIAPALITEESKPEPAPDSVEIPKDAEQPGPAGPKVDRAVEPAAVEAPPTVDAQSEALKDAQLGRIEAPTASPDPAPAPGPDAGSDPDPDPAPLPTPPQPQPPASPTTEPEPEAEFEELTIQAAKLCRKIHGFGSFEPMNANALKPGRSALVYCELAGLSYRAEGDEFVSHVETRVELVRDEDDARVWEVSGEAEDRCRAKRRDSYVGTLITLPESLAPGAYTLRLSQADATSGRTASAEIPVTIAR